MCQKMKSNFMYQPENESHSSTGHSDTPENPKVAAFYVDDIMKCLLSDSRFRANVRLQVRVMLQPTL